MLSVRDWGVNYAAGSGFIFADSLLSRAFVEHSTPECTCKTSDVTRKSEKFEQVEVV